jgi:transposase
MAVEEKLMVFIYITSQGVSNRLAQERFDRGGGSISRLVLLVIII